MVPGASQNTQSVVHWNGEEVKFVASSLGWEGPLEEGLATPWTAIISQAILGEICNYLFDPLYYLNLQ